MKKHSPDACWLGQVEAGVAGRHRGDVVAHCTGGDACVEEERPNIRLGELATRISEVERENAHLRVILAMFVSTTEKLSGYGKTDITSWHLEDQYRQPMELAKELTES